MFFGAVLLTLLVAFGASPAFAQGTCDCNNGCHASPGQCLQRGNCTQGFAPYCDNRASSCPGHQSWVSCGGGCTCVPIPGYDAGVSMPDANVPVDASRPDVVTPVDAARPDVVTPADAARPDVVTPADAARPDVVTPTDAARPDASRPDVVTPVDAGPPCTGVVVDGVCYTDKCRYEGELGWQCLQFPGRACRQFPNRPADDQLYCVPTCAGVMCDPGEFCNPQSGCMSGTADCSGGDGSITCPSGQFCDPSAGCVSDMCPTMECPEGRVCFQNQCREPGTFDGGPNFDAGGNGDGGTDGTKKGGCGCNTVGTTDSSRSVAFAALGLAALFARSRSRRRAEQRS